MTRPCTCSARAEHLLWVNNHVPGCLQRNMPGTAPSCPGRPSANSHLLNRYYLLSTYQEPGPRQA